MKHPLSRLIRSKGYTLSRFAAKLGKSQPTLERWCADPNKIEDIWLVRICQLLNITRKELRNATTPHP